jgi:hypothetical protein
MKPLSCACVSGPAWGDILEKFNVRGGGTLGSVFVVHEKISMCEHLTREFFISLPRVFAPFLELRDCA